MPNYIDREKAREIVCDFCRWAGTSNCEECEHPVDTIPDADVVEVVRCKDCVSARKATKATVLLCDAWSDEYSVAVREDGYCHLGEKTRKVVEIDQVKEAET